MEVQGDVAHDARREPGDTVADSVARYARGAAAQRRRDGEERRIPAAVWGDGVAATGAVREHLAGRFIASGAAAMRTAATVIRERYALRGAPDPTAHPDVRAVITGASKHPLQAERRRELRDPFPVRVLRLWTTEGPGASGAWLPLRDAALAAVGLRTMLRGGNIASLLMTDVLFDADGQGAKLRIARTKTDVRERWIHIDASGGATCPVQLLAASMHHADRPESAFAMPGQDGRALTTGAISDRLRAMAAWADTEGTFSSHSLRIGGAVAAVQAGVPVGTVMAIGGWRSDAVMLYLRSLAAACDGLSERIFSAGDRGTIPRGTFARRSASARPRATVRVAPTGTGSKRDVRVVRRHGRG